MKICVKETQTNASLRLLNSSMLEDQIEELETTRSCPTGYSSRELRSTETIELLHLRKTTFEYLNLRSSKTRNVEFVHLVKRINKELERRKVNIPVSQINLKNEESHSVSLAKAAENNSNMLDEINNYVLLLQNADKGEYCYLARKRGASSKEIVIDNLAICNSHFNIAKISENSIPEFLQDNLPKPDKMSKKSFDYEIFSNFSMSSTELSADKSKKCPKSLTKDLNSSSSYEFDDMSGFVPMGGINCDHEFGADEVLFLTQHN